MAEFCLDCYNKLHHTNYTKWQVIQMYDFCDGCGKRKKTVLFFWKDLLRRPFRYYPFP